MDTNSDAQRQQLIRQIVTAKTREGVDAAKVAVDRWLATHPGDLDVRLHCEQLYMMDEALELMAAEDAARKAS